MEAPVAPRDRQQCDQKAVGVAPSVGGWVRCGKKYDNR